MCCLNIPTTCQRLTLFSHWLCLPPSKLVFSRLSSLTSPGKWCQQPRRCKCFSCKVTDKKCIKPCVYNPKTCKRDPNMSASLNALCSSVTFNDKRQRKFFFCSVWRYEFSVWSRWGVKQLTAGTGPLTGKEKQLWINWLNHFFQFSAKINIYYVGFFYGNLFNFLNLNLKHDKTIIKMPRKKSWKHKNTNEVNDFK